MILELPESLIPLPGDRFPVLALTREGDLLGYFESVDEALEAGGVILYVA